MKDSLSHLSEEQVLDLIERYYDNEKVSDLISEYNIDIRPSELIRCFPPEVLDTTCIYCNIKRIRRRVSRSNPSWKLEPDYCPNCFHHNGERCFCKNCNSTELEKKNTEINDKQKFIDIWLEQYEEDKIDLENLSFIDKVYLGALLREGMSEDYEYIRPAETFINPLAPTREFVLEIIKHLEKIDAIVIHPDTGHNTIVINDYENGNYSYYPYKVMWSLNVKSAGHSKAALVEIIINPIGLDNSQFNEALELWKGIALYESIEYFRDSVENILGIDYEIGDKTKTILSDLVSYYSVSQIYGILYKATNNALRFQAEKGVSMKHASNTIIGNAQSYGDRAKINKWDLQKYNRIKNCPESALSKFFFDRIIKIGINGFHEVPNVNRIQQYFSPKS
jgi:hypothetical protein